MYGWGALEVGKFSRIPLPMGSDDPVIDETVTGDRVGSTTGGYAISRPGEYGTVVRRFMPRDAGPLVSDTPVPTVPTSTPAAPVVIVSNGLQPATVAVADDSAGLPWWVWLGGAGAVAFFAMRGKR